MATCTGDTYCKDCGRHCDAECPKVERAPDYSATGPKAADAIRYHGSSARAADALRMPEEDLLAKLRLGEIEQRRKNRSFA